MPDEHPEARTEGAPGAPTPPAKKGCCLFRAVGCLLQILGLLALLGLIAAAASAIAFHQWARRDLREKRGGEPIVVNVKRGDSLQTIARKLEANQLIGPAPLTMSLALLRRADQRIQVGRYEFVPGTPPIDVIDALTRGVQPDRPPDVRVTLPEGWTADRMARRLEEQGVIESADRFLALTRDMDLLTTLGLPSKSAEGYLFPDTYLFRPKTDERTVIRRLVARHNETLRLLNLKPGLNVPRAQPLTYHEHVVLASVIQREARLNDEMPLISSVYHNRLKRRMHLGSCATVRYALSKWDAPLTKSDLDVDSPYNTYRRLGLPPGPICSPGRHALDAAFRPDESDYLYYVYKGDGRHAFSKTDREHLNLRRQYKDAWQFSARGSDEETSATTPASP